MAALHELELLTLLGVCVTALLALFAPLSRARPVAVWVTVGSAAAALAFAGPEEAMYPAYAVAVLHALGAWLTSRRVQAAPRMAVWRKGSGHGLENVTSPPSALHWLGRVFLFVVSGAAVAVAQGWLALPGA